jgi:hypothetical protein
MINLIARLLLPWVVFGVSLGMIAMWCAQKSSFPACHIIAESHLDHHSVIDAECEDGSTVSISKPER